MTVSIKDFKIGQAAYKVIMNMCRNKEPEMYEVKVKKVGRKYITTEFMGWEHKYHCKGKYCLEDNSDYGYTSLLFPDARAARDYISAYHIKLKIKKFVSTMAFDNMELKKLERIEDIIEETKTNE